MTKAGFRFKPFRHRPEESTRHAKPEGIDLTEADIDDQLSGDKVSALFLGSFELDVVKRSLNRFGITQRLAELGYDNLDIHFRPHGPFEHFLTIRDASHPELPQIGEIVLKESRSLPATQFVPEIKLPSLSLLSIEWILMQHIRGHFTADHRRLPGQDYPGLGVGKLVVAQLQWVAQIMHKDGLMNVPEYFHNATFYAKWFHFLDPRIEGAMEAVVGQLGAAGYDISEISFAVYFECLIDRNTGAAFEWRPHEQVLPLSPILQEYFAHPAYHRQVAETRDSLSLAVDEPRFREHMLNANHIEW